MIKGQNDAYWYVHPWWSTKQYQSVFAESLRSNEKEKLGNGLN